MSGQMSGQMSNLEPWLLLVLVGVLPTEVWRFLAVFAAHRLDEDSEVLVFVRAVATALLAGIVAKLLLTPAGALALVPTIWRLSAIVFAMAVHFAARRSVAAAVIAGEAAMVCAAWWFG